MSEEEMRAQYLAWLDGAVIKTREMLDGLTDPRDVALVQRALTMLEGMAGEGSKRV